MKKIRGILLILLLLLALLCHREKRKIIIISEVQHQDGYYEDNYETIYIKGIPKEVDHGHAVSGKWYFDVRDINDVNDSNVHSVHVDESIWGNDSYYKGDTLEISLKQYQNIFSSPGQDKNHAKNETETETDEGTVIIINNVVITDTIYN